MHPCGEELIYPVFHKTITPGPSAIHLFCLPCKTLCTTNSKHPIHLQMPLRMGLVCMKSHANLAANAIEDWACLHEIWGQFRCECHWGAWTSICAWLFLLGVVGWLVFCSV
jgi:hypothetical protein